jgi:hypothetical protein
MSRRPLRTHGRRFALGLSLLLVAGALTVPAALASDNPYTFVGRITAEAGAMENSNAKPFTFSFELANTSDLDDRILGSANLTVPLGITVTDPSPFKLNKKNDQIIEYRGLKIRQGQNRVFTFTGAVDCLGDDLATDPTFGVEAKASADFGGRGMLLQNVSDEGQLTLFRSDLCPEGTEQLTAWDGSEVSFDVDLKDLYETFEIYNVKECPVDATEDCKDLSDAPKVVQDLNDGCDVLLDAVTPGNSKRLSDFLVYLVPNDEVRVEDVTVTFRIPALVVNERSPSSHRSYVVCFAGDEKKDGALTGNLEAPYFLPDCGKDNGPAPCVENRAKNSDGDVEIIFRIPPGDPGMR